MGTLADATRGGLETVAILRGDRDALLAFYDFPAEHWKHLRTTNPLNLAAPRRFRRASSDRGRSRLLSRGTDGSNPSPSSRESSANLSFSSGTGEYGIVG